MFSAISTVSAGAKGLLFLYTGLKTTFTTVKEILHVVDIYKSVYNYFIPAKKESPLLTDLQTGDIVLFRGTSILGKTLEYVGHSAYSHVGIILKNPGRFLEEPRLVQKYLGQFAEGDANQKIPIEDGVYILESVFDGVPDAENGNIKLGVQIHDFVKTLEKSDTGSVYIRHLHCLRDEKFYDRLSKIHQCVHNTPYDLRPKDWLKSWQDLDMSLKDINDSPDKNQFWCSALVAYVMMELGLINPINFSVITPKDFSLEENGRIDFLCPVDKEKLLY